MVNSIPCYDYRNEIITHFTQWDVNQTITIKGLNIDNAPIFHFYNKKYTESIGVQSILKDGNIIVDVPNILLETDLPINVFVYLITQSSGKSIYEFHIPIHSKKKPADYLYIDNIKELIVGGYTLDSIKQELNESITNAENSLSLLNTENSKAQTFINELSDKNITPTISSIISGYYGFEGYDDILGLQVDYENKVFTRLAGAVGLNAGDDFDQFSMYGGMKRCNVSDNGAITAYYGDDNYTEDGSNGQVMVYIPKFYYKVVPLKLDKIEDTGFGYHIRKANYYITDTPKPGFKLHPAFINEDGKEVDYFLYSAYEGSVFRTSVNDYFDDAEYQIFTISNTDLLSSVSGKKPITGQRVLLTRYNAEMLATNRSGGWHCQTLKAISALQFLIMIELGTMNVQTALSYGVTGTGKDYSTINYSALTGATNNLGNKSGQASSTFYRYWDNTQKTTISESTTSDRTLSCSYRGIENPWGNSFKWVEGINIWGNGFMSGGQAYICNDFNFAENRNNGNYSPIGFTLPEETAYISAIGYGDEKYDWVFLPSESKGTSILPVGDQGYNTKELDKYTTMMCSGAWGSNNAAGMFVAYVTNAYTYKNIHVGCRLIYLPQD